MLQRNFPIMFPERAPSAEGHSSRFYRDNFLVMIEKDRNVMYNIAGKALTIEMKVRKKDEGGLKDLPWTFVERHPWWALEYEW